MSLLTRGSASFFLAWRFIERIPDRRCSSSAFFFLIESDPAYVDRRSSGIHTGSARADGKHSTVWEPDASWLACAACGAHGRIYDRWKCSLQMIPR